MQHVYNMPARSVIHARNTRTYCWNRNMISRGYVFKLKPTPAQESLFAQVAGVCRLIYTLALEQRRDHYRAYGRATGKSVSYPAQARELTELRREYD
ncbi:MAG: helix-turn-helix domain-containing protein, partial [Alphaproteobacteria bacterium]|nr:helix-turn-helix domain-containing protein [Alphaproteobacteria bacterium]